MFSLGARRLSHVLLVAWVMRYSGDAFQSSVIQDQNQLYAELFRTVDLGMHLDYSRQLVYSRRLQVLEKEFSCVTTNRTTYPLRKKVAGLVLIANYNPNISSLTDAQGCKSVRISHYL